MGNAITGIDHPLLAVTDLDAAAERWQRLGFALTPAGTHPQWGTANRCIMFPGNYIELLAPAAAGAAAERLSAFLADRGEGGYGLALASRNAAASHAGLVGAGISAAAPAILSRPLSLPEGVVMPRFAIVALPDELLAPLTLFACQHLTPALLRQPAWLAHPNGARRLVSATLVVEDPEAARRWCEQIFGPGSTTATDEVVAVHAGEGMLLLCRPDDLGELHPEADDRAESVPALAAITIAVADIEAATRLLRTNGVSFGRGREGTLRVGREAAGGVLLELVRG